MRRISAILAVSIDDFSSAHISGARRSGRRVPHVIAAWWCRVSRRRDPRRTRYLGDLRRRRRSRLRPRLPTQGAERDGAEQHGEQILHGFALRSLLSKFGVAGRSSSEPRDVRSGGPARTRTVGRAVATGSRRRRLRRAATAARQSRAHRGGRPDDGECSVDDGLAPYDRRTDAAIAVHAMRREDRADQRNLTTSSARPGPSRAASWHRCRRPERCSSPVGVRTREPSLPRHRWRPCRGAPRPRSR
jgi:hypothetical protein